MLRGADGKRLRFTEALFWSLTWGIGAGLGVALGGWLTVVGGSGAPGTAGLDVAYDLFVLPIVAGVSVTLVHLLGQLVAAVLRGRAHDRAQSEDAQQGADDNGVAG